MSRCSDRRFERYLHAYELGMLTDEERAAFEVHQLECHHCFREAAGFADTANLLRYDEEVDRELKRLQESSPDEEGVAKVGPKRWASGFRRKAAYWRTALVVAAALVVLLLKPWRLEFEATHDVRAHQNRLAVIDFADGPAVPESERLGATVAGLLISDLSQFEHLQVVSRQQLLELAGRLGWTGADDIDREAAVSIAREAGVDWVIIGEVVRDGAKLALVAELVEITSGDVATSQRITGKTGESVFALVDRLSVAIREALPLPESTDYNRDRPVAEVTTHSPAAYRYYLDGTEFMAGLYRLKACASWEKAVAEDSTFAMAYYQLAQFGLPCMWQELIQKAQRYSDRVSRREQLLIASAAACVDGRLDRAMALASRLEVLHPNDRSIPFLRGRFYHNRNELDQSIECLRAATRIDPYYREAWNLLAYVYAKTGDTESALDIAEHYISVSPDEPNAYDTKGELLLASGRTDESIEAFRQALERDPGFIWSAYHLQMAYLTKGDFAGIDDLLAGVSSADATVTSETHSYLRGLSLAYRGRFREALDALGDKNDLSTDRVGWSPFGWGSFVTLRARLHRARGEYDRALELQRAIVESNERTCSPIPVTGLCDYVLCLAEAGQLEAARIAATDLRQTLVDARALERFDLMTEGVLRFVEGKMMPAAAAFEEAAAIMPSYFGSVMIGRSYLEAGRSGKAIPIFEALAYNTDPSRHVWSTWDATIHYYLGVAYDESGQADAALSALTEYLSAHEAADPGLWAIEDAQSRVSRLQSQP